MKGNFDQSEQSAKIRKQPEEIAQNNASLYPQGFDFLSPEKIMQILHELRVHQERVNAGEIDHFCMEKRFISKSGQTVYEILNASLIRDADGRPLYFLGSVEDMTERKRAEQALQESEALYRSIGESIDYGVWVCTPDGGNMYVSDSFLKMAGITQEQCSNFG